MHNVVIVGYGRIARASHVPALLAHAPHYRVSHIVDPDPVARSAARELLGDNVETCATLDHLWAVFDDQREAGWRDPVLWIICTPSGLHASQAADILARRERDTVLIEKPVATQMREVENLVRILERRPFAHCYVVKQNRFNPGVELLHQAIRSGRMGRLYSLNSTVAWNRNDEYYRQAPWRGTWRQDGGVFLNQAVHYIDLLRWLGGPVDRVQGETMTLARHIEAEDTGAIMLRYKSGALGTLQATVLTPGGNLEGSLTAIAEHGVVRLGGTALNRMEIWRLPPPRSGREGEDDAAMDSAAATLRNAENPASVYGNGHGRIYSELAGGLTSRLLPGPAEGCHALEIVLASYHASRSGQSVSLPLETARAWP